MTPVSATSEARLAIDGLAKRYDDVVAVADLSLAVGPGEVVGLLGPNGAGKSTTVGCITGLVRPDAGSIRIGGHDASRPDRAVRSMVGLAAQDVALYPDLAVETNLRFFGRLGGLRSRALGSSVRELARRLGLDDLLHRRVRDLSGGQQRLVHLAAASVHRPALLVLDEPTAGLDVQARAQVLAFVADLAGTGTSVLYSSHYLAEVEELCDRVAIVDRGRLVAEGTVAGLIASHGRGRIEVDVDGTTHVRSGIDVAAAVRALDHLGPIADVRVLRPSLEAVFVELTGTRIDSPEAEA